MVMRNRILVCLVLASALYSCQACNKAQGETVAKTTVSFRSLRHISGMMLPFSLSATDGVTLVHPASGERATSTPSSVGGSTSFFLLNLKNPSRGDRLVGYYPASASVSVQPSAVTYPLPSKQDGSDLQPIYIGTTQNNGSAYGGNALVMSQMSAVVRSVVPQGNHSLREAELRGNNSEGVAGTISWDPAARKVTSATEKSITLTPPAPIDCSTGAQRISIVVPPVDFTQGLTVTFTFTDGSTSEVKVDDPLHIAPGQLVNTTPSDSERLLLICGGDKVHMIDEKAALEAGGDYRAGLRWTWLGSAHASEIGRSISSSDLSTHISEAKPIDGGKKMLVTASNGWAALVDIENPGDATTFGKVLWSAVSGVTNAHSAELLPDGKIAMAVADGVDKVLLYNGSGLKEKPLASYPLISSHAVAWCGDRLYAAGASTLQIFKVEDASLVLEREIKTGSYVSGLHDMLLIDESPLLVMAGNRAAFFNTETLEFTTLPHFNPFGSIKSINYNAYTGESYYTYAGKGLAEGDYNWSTHTIRYTDDVLANDDGIDKKTIKVDNLNMYKVRVLNW